MNDDSKKSSGSFGKKTTVQIDTKGIAELQEAVSQAGAIGENKNTHITPPHNAMGQGSISGSMDKLPKVWRALFDKRYRLGRVIGEGGMGVVHEAFDRAIGRLVAIKLLKEPVDVSKEEVYKLIREIQITGQLEHPNIMPIYDIGVLTDSRLFFVMKLIRGKNLKDVIYDESVPASGPKRRHHLRRLLSIFVQICNAVDFAHSKGVIHRDLKPENVMVGDFGEVLVLDWGLAHIKEFNEPFEGIIRNPKDLVRTLSTKKTIDGSIIGTPCYMSPEQAQGLISKIDERTDVFGLGGLLYEMLSGYPPISGSDAFDVITKAATCDIKPPQEVSPYMEIPNELDEICMKALAEDPNDRYQSAHELVEAIERYLEGSVELERKEKEARQHLIAGKEALAKYYKLRTELGRLKAEVSQKEAELKRGQASLAEKERLWIAEDHLKMRALELSRIYTEALAHLQSAANLAPDPSEARKALSDLFWIKYIEAEKEGREDDAIFFKSMLERYHDGRYANQLAGEGIVEISGVPKDAEVLMVHMEERKRRLLPVGNMQVLGTGPARLTLPRGYYLITIRREGFVDSLYPIFVERMETVEIEYDSIPNERLLDGFVWIPSGYAKIGGEEDGTFGALPAQQVFVDGFCMSKLPVTIAEYIEFLNDVRNSLSEKELVELVPQPYGTTGKLYFKRKEDGSFFMPEIDDDGDRWSLNWPVFGITYQNAIAYIRWRSKRDGVEYRLPSDFEWEKAGRGMDGRLFPWGNQFVRDFCNMRFTKLEGPSPSDVGSFPIDCSPYGVLDMAGNMRDWCEGFFDEERKMRLIRGGAWSMYEMFSRLSCRTAEKPQMRSVNIGFRLVYSPFRTDS